MSDDYAKKYMGGEKLRFLDKVRLPWWMHATLLGSGVVAVTATLLTPGVSALVPLAMGAMSALSWALFTTIRVSVTNEQVHIQYGVFGPKIPLTDITSVEVVKYTWLQYGGWGIRRSRGGGWAYSVPGRGGLAVRIKHMLKGKEHVVDVSSEQPEALAAAIQDARSGRARDLTAAREELGAAMREVDALIESSSASVEVPDEVERES